VLTTAQAGPRDGRSTGTGWPPPPAADRTAQLAVAEAPRVVPDAGEQSRAWLRGAAAGLVLLAAAAAAVSFSAQYRMTDAARRLPAIAGLEAAIPDTAALVFACLGIALALHGRRAVRARFLNLAAVGTSVFMNAIAAAPGWRDLAIWVMPPVAYALASDTLISVVRAHAVVTAAGAGEEATPLAALGGLVLWLLRLLLAPASTLAGFRSWAIAECPVAPGCRPAPPRPGKPARTPATTRPDTSAPALATAARPGTKTARFLDLAAREHGPLATTPLTHVGRIAASLAPRVGLNAGAARTALRKAVLAAQNRSPR
jgi:hypothetical protein